MISMKIIVFLVTFSVVSNAAFKELWMGYQTSTLNQLRSIETKSVKNNLRYFLNANPWQLKLSVTHDDTFLDALFSFQAQKTLKQTKEISLAKSTYSYGDISLSLSQTNYDLSNWDSGVGSSNSDEVYETRANITYSYDFFNRKSYFEEKRIIQNNLVQIIENSAQKDKEHLDFFKAYLEAKLSVYTYELAKEMKVRASKRLNIINRRVKDGLSRKVESYQAESSLLKQEQEVYKSQASLKEKLAIVELVLKRNIPMKYFSELTWNFYPFTYWQENLTAKTNFQLQVAQERISLIEIENKKLANEKGHSLKLNAKYISNAFDEEVNDSFKDATSSPYNDSKVISVEYVIPFGNSYRDSVLQKRKIDKQRAEYQLLDIKDKIQMNKDVLLYNIGLFEKAYGLAKKQVQLTEKIMNEQNKLYLRSLATFDDVIRAEESYINSSVSEKQILFNYESLIIEYAYYLGSLGDIIERYRD